MAIPTRPRRPARRGTSDSSDGYGRPGSAHGPEEWDDDGDRVATRVRPDARRGETHSTPTLRRRVGSDSGGSRRAHGGSRPGDRTGRGLRRVRLVDGRPGGRVRLGVPYQSAWLSYVVALVLFVFLTSGNMVRSVRAMDIGPVRTITLPVVQGIDRVSNLLSLNRPADALGSALGREVDDPADQPVDFDASSTDREDTTPPLREVTAQVPLEVHVAGDSMGQTLGQLMEAAGVDDPTLDVTYEYKISSGLARPDYYNWPARFAEIAKDVKPEALVMMIGGNDAQELTDAAGNVVARPATAEWDREYRRRVDELFDGLRADNRRLFWVLQPDVASSKHQRSVDAMNAQARASAKSRPWVTLVDAGALTAGADGGYSDYLTLDDGSRVSCRQSDGVHLTTDCTQLVSAAAVADIAATWEIGEPAAPAGTPLDLSDGRDASGPGTPTTSGSPAAETNPNRGTGED
jgi:hypothetical protein